MKKIIKYIYKHPKRCIIIGILLVWYYFSISFPLFNDPTATVIQSREGILLGAKIAKDGQWRFPEIDSVPYKFEQSLLAFEDQQFYRHFGFNPIAITQALIENIKAQKVVRGGSTLTQQVIRLSRKGKKRTYIEKMIELILATRLELGVSKNEILKLYASHAPFGGNVVGLDMAAWRYFGLPANQLSWAESATLAVLPNAPALIYPGKNQLKLKRKRDHVLKTLWEQGTIDLLTYELALEENLPQKPYALPQIAPHALMQIAKQNEGMRVQASIKYDLQKQINTIVRQHYEIQKQNEVYNMAVVVIDVSTREVLSYVGNTPTDKQHQKDVDIIQAPRSTGSTLKPLLYAAMLDKGELLPEQLVPDIPTVIAGYSPENYDETYNGAVPANRALARSLNIPAVRLLQQYGLARFREEIQAYKIKDLKFSADHYGLSLILGGAEASLWDLCKTYAGLTGTLNHYQKTSSEYYTQEFVDPKLIKTGTIDFGKKVKEEPIVGAGSIWLTYEAMKEVNRPEGDEAWEFYDSSRQIAWKTGTSFGNRDAWAIGTTSDYVVGVWVGNADGEGRPELTGVHSAAPVLFDVFNLLPRSKWFETPYDDVVKVEVCTKSGFLASAICPKKEVLVPQLGNKMNSCPYHQQIHLDAQRQYRVNSSCEPVAQIQQASWFVLPPLMAYYYKNTDATYKALPPYRSDCQVDEQKIMDFIFPKERGSVFLARDFNGKVNEVILKVAHTQPKTKVFWYLDNQFLGTTQQFHEMPILPSIGKHMITVLDEYGNEIKRVLEVKE
ncbi:penicillin-binding protein 1C [Aquimarina rhabdastrellae]